MKNINTGSDAAERCVLNKQEALHIIALILFNTSEILLVIVNTNLECLFFSFFPSFVQCDITLEIPSLFSLTIYLAM